MQFPKKKIIKSKSNYKKYGDEHLYCEWVNCNRPRWLGPHHITFRSQGGGDEDENLISLCKKHHDYCHGPDSRIARTFLKDLKRGQDSSGTETEDDT